VRDKIIISVLVTAIAYCIGAMLVIAGLTTANGLAVLAVIATCSVIVVNHLCWAMCSRRRSKRNG